ncbi:hypothetical protein X777_14439, partial [Ooceraea biroi]
VDRFCSVQLRRRDRFAGKSAEGSEERRRLCAAKFSLSPPLCLCLSFAISSYLLAKAEFHVSSKTRQAPVTATRRV